jgi:nucleotidyltransferase/DNA polymerase involved in DNA repair
VSVLCCHVPNLLIEIACRREPGWRGRALALLGPDERVWAVSPAAAECGVQVEMRPQQAQIACPELLLRPLELATAEAEQGALLAALAEWELPVEPQTWGVAYVDLHSVAKTAAAVQPLAADLGRRLRNGMGEHLQPALGWDSGKFTARAAAMQVAPGRMRLVDKRDEVHFLGPLPITLLPLPRAHLQQLHWLGIRSLGQFAGLPAAAVWQRFGAAGKQAQRWAQGRDDRPVRAAVTQVSPPLKVVLDPPSGTLQPVVEAVMASLRPLLIDRAAALEGVRRLRIVVSFVAGEQQSADLVFVEPASQARRMQAVLVQQLCRMRWPSKVESVQWTLLECGELTTPQLTLFAESNQRLRSLSDLADKLSSRYSPLLFQANLPHATHPVPERRGAFQPLAQALAESFTGTAAAHVSSLA